MSTDEAEQHSLATFYREEELDEDEWLGYSFGSWCSAPFFSVRFPTLTFEERVRFRKWGKVHNSVMEAEFEGNTVVPSEVVRTFFGALGPMRDGFTERGLWLKLATSSDAEEPFFEEVDVESCDDQKPAELIPIFEEPTNKYGIFAAPDVLEGVCTVEIPKPLTSFVFSPKGPSTWPGRFYVPPGGQKPEDLQEVECLFHDRHVASQMDCRLFFATQPLVDGETNPTPEEVVRKSEKPWRCNVFIDASGRVERVCNG